MRGLGDQVLIDELLEDLVCRLTGDESSPSEVRRRGAGIAHEDLQAGVLRDGESVGADRVLHRARLSGSSMTSFTSAEESTYSRRRSALSAIVLERLACAAPAGHRVAGEPPDQRLTRRRFSGGHQPIDAVCR